ncbi:hypothetical protein ASE01_20205 [Nocardioides sp. Root190]|uniref:hypothetical protein n=1 Tax=Nocardioides sp. Root190 TaxID=1736488 RepID=UPI0006FD65B0|nr:hypothetical protein [Nocardioides sp. Root190]KRB73099.1 hypothetical protein ASE01_20205 [Nocardioides sp. Root190]
MSTTNSRDAGHGLACWCCGATFDESTLVRLGAHPEVGLCFDCARWTHRRAVEQADAGRAGIGVHGRQALRVVRAQVIRLGIHDWPLIGRLLRQLDQRLP